MENNYWKRRAKSAEEVIKEFVRITGKKDSLTNENSDTVLSVDDKNNEILYNKIAEWTQVVLEPNVDTIKDAVDTLIDCGFVKYEITNEE